MNSNFFFLCFVFTLITLNISPAKAFILINQSKQNYDDYNNIPIEINDTELTDNKLNEFAQIEEFEELLPAPMAQGKKSTLFIMDSTKLLIIYLALIYINLTIQPGSTYIIRTNTNNEPKENKDQSITIEKSLDKLLIIYKVFLKPQINNPPSKPLIFLKSVIDPDVTPKPSECPEGTNRLPNGECSSPF
ncbi:hypothetical protein KQX54_016690 [Cotesia glomerata]|uniref:Venom protein n=1 Tax=Cotesia glomerata TaxID=32391 RepID=A0AAV7IZD0_COTGL|nr:hypothetical protein KQX54_016690 [Cotesia glomerata]